MREGDAVRATNRYGRGVRGRAGAALTIALVAGATLTLAPAASVAQTAEYPQLTRGAEIRLAMSAGPPAVGSAADVYVMGDGGFERAVEGTNGWACIVVRVAANKSNLAPHCLNPTATESVLPAFLLEGELQARGMSAEAIETEMKRQWSSGELALPSGPAYAYMMSEGQKLGPNGGKFRPHFMLYVPYVKNSDIGGDPARMEFPFVGPVENHPLSTVVIITDEFVSPEDVMLPGS